MHKYKSIIISTCLAICVVTTALGQSFPQDKLGLSCFFAGETQLPPSTYIIDLKNGIASQDQKFFGPVVSVSDDAIIFKIADNKNNLDFTYSLNRWSGDIAVFDKSGVFTKLWFKCSKISRMF
ncbi:hypothetical protein [Limnohabitans sp. Bal53]|uniref:hypothetical protein n=1 Tax=Limnohabitans sp. Bal53 TaxID=1977910 RepID=UPI0011B1E27C|nr:hypothetical protein [Limnohabitans sp. Bal53]